MDYTVHEILQARKLEWVAFPFSRGSSWSRNLTGISRIAGGFFTYWAIRETHVCHRVNIKVSCNLRWWKGIRVIALIDTNILSPNVYMLKKKKKNSHGSLFSQFLHSGRKALFLFFDWCDPAAEELVCWEAARWVPPLTRIKDSTFHDSLSFKVWHLLSTHPMGKRKHQGSMEKLFPELKEETSVWGIGKMVNVLVRHSENLCHGLDSHSQVHSPGIGKLQIFATLASTSVEILKDVGLPDHLTCLLRNCMQVKKQHLEANRNNELVQDQERSTSKLYILTLLIQLICRVHQAKCWGVWSSSWNQDCWEKYQ